MTLFIALLAIYIFFLRSLSAVFVFLVPSAILVIASGVLTLIDSHVFAVTLGFGGVLLGIADEYAMLADAASKKEANKLVSAKAKDQRAALATAATANPGWSPAWLRFTPAKR